MAIAPNILDGIERDPKVKLLVAFLEQVLNVEKNDIREILIAETHESQMRSAPGWRPDVTDWNASVTLGNRLRQLDIIISNSRGNYSIESVVFCGGFQEQG